ncbi:MAG TPA: hypothetical protein VEX35_09845 [Allosphingosinicella sp.]|nr:hypothetical protein [Allosphingosinicella sp.]
MWGNVAYFLLAIGWSVVFTLVLLFVRSRVRNNRQRLIEEMGVLFFPDPKSAIAAFDYVRAKYELQTVAEQQHSQRTIRRSSSAWALFGASMPYIILCAIGFIVLFVPKQVLLSGSYGLPMLYDNLFWAMAPGPSAPVGSGEVPPGGKMVLLEAAAVLSAAFLGGYLMTVRVLLRAVQNYELSQLTFLQTAVHLTFGMVSSMMLYHILRQTGVGALLGGGLDVFPGFLLLGFLGGYMPDLGIFYLFSKLQVRWLKTMNPRALELVAVVPLEVLDGIDYDVRYRLQEAGFYDVQNLAVANPLLMYVETPYTLYQAFDWVLQAQLCTAVGPETFRVLKEHRIRTSLDLERAVLGDDAPDEFVLSIGALIFPPSPGNQAGQPLSADSVRHGVMVMLDDLHVHRMRALWEHIFSQIRPGPVYWIYRSQPGLHPAAPKAGTAKGGEKP